jgi:hypothetical protein
LKAVPSTKSLIIGPSRFFGSCGSGVKALMHHRR